jgi:hypothetical protein
MSLGPSPIARRRRLGAELCTLRERSKLSPVELGGLLGWTETKVRRLETARVRPNVGEVMDLLDALRVTGLQREHVLDLAREAMYAPGWHDSYNDGAVEGQHAMADLENNALEMWEFQLTLFPGMLQCPEYAIARFGSRPSVGKTPVDLVAAVRKRMARQQALTRATPFSYEAILDESLLIRRCGPPGVRTLQLDYLIDLARLPTVTVRVLPHDAPVAKFYVPTSAFVYFRLADPVDPELIVLDTESSSLVLSDNDDVTHYRRLFEAIREASFPADDSLELLRAARDNPEEIPE